MRIPTTTALLALLALALAPWLTACSDAPGPTPASRADGEPASQGTAAPPPLDDVPAELFAPATSDARRAELWREVESRGESQALLATLEGRAAASPDDATSRTSVGMAYRHLHAASDDEAERVRLARLAMDAFQAALELDAAHWLARFELARHLAEVDQPGAALRQLELLRRQQPAREPQPHHARTYVFIGDLHMRRQLEQAALEVWSDGLARFPDDAELQARLAELK